MSATSRKRSWLARIFGAPPAPPPRPPVAYCTLASTGYLPHVRVLFASLRAVRPDSPFTLLFVAEEPGETPPQLDGVRVVTAEDLVPAELLRTLRRRYTLGELCFALKPWLLRSMVRSQPRVVYVDADTRFYAAPDSLENGLDHALGVLTPHLDAPIPEDGRLPTEMTMLRAGLFNAGLVALRVGEDAYRFLDWWCERVARWGYAEPALGYLGDQRWLDAAPVLFPPFAVLRDPGYNVGYWNLHSRKLETDSGTHHLVAGRQSGLSPNFAERESGLSPNLLVNQRPLVHFHFSGFDPAQPARISRYQDRIEATGDALLAPLLRDYANELVTAGWKPAAQPEVPEPAGEKPEAMAWQAYRARIECAPLATGVIEMGEEIVAHLTVTNDSPVAWKGAPPGPGALGLTWHLVTELYDIVVYSNPRTFVTEDLPAGESRAFTLSIRAPGKPGRYKLIFDLVHEGVDWFHTRGSPRCEVPIDVAVLPRGRESP